MVGVCEITSPSGTVSEYSSVLRSTVRPLASSAAWALSASLPVQSRSWIGRGPLLTIRSTAESGRRVVPASGSLPRTVPSATVSEYLPMDWPNDRWVLSSASWAWSSVIPFVRGTSYRSLPRDSTTRDRAAVEDP